MKKIILTALISILTLPVFAAKVQEINIIPQPQKVEPSKGTFKVSGVSFNCSPDIDSLSKAKIMKFATRLSLRTGKTNSLAYPIGLEESLQNGKIKGFIFLKDSSMGEEEYSIDIQPKRTVVKAAGFKGYLYALETLRQLLPVEFNNDKEVAKVKWVVPCVKIEDKPRFAYRGLHLDCSRHFFEVSEVKKYLDIMALHKMNTLHWHLTDDQGWRLEIKKYPRLTEIGGFRNGTMVGKDFSSNDGVRYGGFYTQDQIKDIVKYAASLGITIIPEIDLPGHMIGALAAYPSLGCTGGPYEVAHVWGVMQDVLCPGKPATIKFLKDVLSEVVELFPSEYIHIGGDECPKVRWQECPDCQNLIKKLGLKSDEKHTAEQYLQSYVTSTVQKFLASKGRKIIGWDEILEGKLDPGATVMSWRGTKGGIAASKMGFDVIMTPTTYLYFDYAQSENPDSEPIAFPSKNLLDHVYSYEPFDGVSPEAQSHILGAQANLWTEYIPTNEQLEYMLLPRAAALSEIQWCKPEDKNWTRFRKSLEDFVKIYEACGYNYRKLD